MRWMRFFCALVLVEAALGQSLKPEKTITVPPDAVVRFTAVSPKGDWIAGACQDGRVRLWSFPSGELRQSFDLQDQRVSSLRFSGDETLLAVGGDRGGVRIWNIPSGKLKLQLKGGESVVALAISPDRTLLAIARKDVPAQLWDLTSERVITELPAKFAGSLALDFSPDGQWLACADADTDIRIYESRTGALRATTSALLLETFAIAFAADSKSLYAGGADKTVSVIDVAGGNVVRKFPRQPDAVSEFRRSPEGKILLVLYFDETGTAKPAPVVAWNVAEESVEAQVSKPEVTPNGGGFSGNGRVIFTSSAGAKLQVWSLQNRGK
jgi:WD40 repeat protein